MTTTSHRLYFGEWLDAYDGSDPAIADLRKDFRRSYCFRNGSCFDFKTPREMFWDLKFWSACPESFEALKSASDLYTQQPNAYPNNWEELFNS